MHVYRIVLRMQNLIGKIKRVVTGTSQRRDNGVRDLEGRDKKKKKNIYPDDSDDGSRRPWCSGKNKNIKKAKTPNESLVGDFADRAW